MGTYFPHIQSNNFQGFTISKEIISLKVPLYGHQVSFLNLIFCIVFSRDIYDFLQGHKKSIVNPPYILQ
jgi:hypothetical protein